MTLAEICENALARPAASATPTTTTRSARIPNYHLRAAHEQQPMFAHTPVVTIRSSIDALRLKLWDEERGCLVGYPARRARPAAATDRRGTALIPS